MVLKYDDMDKEELINHIKKIKRDKRYGLIWEDKPEKMDYLLEDSYPVLKHISEKDINSGTTDKINFLIEGDNLHSLSLLNITHQRKVDTILIDPPYNTGNKDFYYHDTYVDKDDSWRHSKWISFMNRRLSMSRRLLKDDGIVFIHIDENEFAQLKLLCDEIFGYDNFLGVFIWKARSGKGGTNDIIAHQHEFVFCYAKNKDKARIRTDKKVSKAREEQLRQWGQEVYREDRPPMFFPLLYDPEKEVIGIVPKDKCEGIYDAATESFDDNYLNELRKEHEEKGWHFILPMYGEEYGRWRVGWTTAKDLLKKDDIFFVKDGDTFKAKRRYAEGNVTESAVGSLILDKGTASNGTAELKRIFGSKVFDTTKPLDITEFLIDLSMFDKDKGIVLDFFAGSGTTGEAVLEYNQKHNKQLNFILCTNNEMKKSTMDELLSRGLTEDSEEFKDEGVCRKITYPKLQSVVNGYEYEGTIKDVIDEVKLTVTNIKRMDETLKKWGEKEAELRDNYGKVKNRVNGKQFQLIGETKYTGFKEGIPANLKYFMTDIVEKDPNLDQMKIVMAKRIYEILCLKENCFELVDDQYEYKLYQQGDKLMGIYTDFMNLFFDEFKEKMAAHDAKEKVIYNFSFTDYMDESLFEDVKDKMQVKPIPTQLIRMLDELRK